MLSGLSLVCMLQACGKSEQDAPVEASIARGGGAGIKPPLEAGEGASETFTDAMPFPITCLSDRQRFTTVSVSAIGLLAASSAGRESCKQKT